MSAVPPPVPSANNKPVKKKWTVELPQDKTPQICDLRTAVPAPLDAVDWNAIKAIKFLEGGDDTRGAVAVETIANHILLVKGEIFGSLFANEVFGLPAPKMRLIEYLPKTQQMEWYLIKQALVDLIPEHHPKRIKILKDLDRAFYIVMEFVPGCNMLQLSSTQVQHVLDNAATFLFDFGTMFVMDLLLNNWDRVPGTIWQNEGNAGNVMFNWQTLRVAPIDQMCTTILHDSNLTKYLISVREFAQSKNVDSLAKFWEQTLGVALNDEHKQHLLAGVQHGISKAKALDRKTLDNLKSKTAAMLTGEDWANVWANSLCEIDVDFMLDVVKILQYIQ